MPDRNGYIGRAPSDSSVIVARQVFSPTGIQTTFTFASGYTIGYLDIYLNGARLISGQDYTATNGSTVGLTTYADSGDVLEAVAYKAFNISNPISNTTGDLTVGGNLTVSGSYSGDGSGLTGIVTGITAGDNISVSGSTGNVTITGLANTSNVIADTVSTGTLNVTGISTFTGQLSGAGASFTGNVSVGGPLTADTVSTGTLNVTGISTFTGQLSGAGASFTGNVSVGGTLTYEDVTNVDSIGIITARSGVRITTGGLIVTAGISTFKGAHFDGGSLLKEKINITAGKLSDNTNINIDNGMSHLFTTTETTTSTPNIISSVGINTLMAIGDTMAVTIITTASAAGYSTAINIDGSFNDVLWSGGSDPSTGGASGQDVYSLQVIKTGIGTFTVLGALNNFA